MKLERKSGVLVGIAAIALLGGFLVARAFPIWEASASPEGTAPPVAQTVEDEAALADGVVTQVEYDAAFGRFRACVEAAGFSFQDEPRLTRFQTYDFVLVRPGTTADDARAAHADSEHCQRDFDAISYSWSLDHGPTAEDEVELRNLTAACLIEGGVDIAAEPTYEEFAAVMGSADEAIRVVFVGCHTHSLGTLDWTAPKP